MLRHPRYLDMPWDIPYTDNVGVRHHWWLIAALVAAALLLIGVRTTGGS